jgi:hypothetical protein
MMRLFTCCAPFAAKHTMKLTTSVNDDHPITLEEWIANGRSEEEFRALDVDGSGTIEENEIPDYLKAADPDPDPVVLASAAAAASCSLHHYPHSAAHH